jgi:glycosyltransferase involved in cell wall biosynthesis
VQGFIVAPRNSAAIAEGLQKMADDHELLRTMREAAIRRVRSLGGWEDYGNRMVALLQQLTSATAG